jgi:ABC-type multidrug transport system fused ATPase/permease subunit
VPQCVEAYDEYFLNIKEGVKGVTDIRILGKADERSAEFEKLVQTHRRQVVETNQSIALSTGFNAILFSIITIAIIIFATVTELKAGELEGLVVLNTAIQYINRVWTGSHQIFVWFFDFIPRGAYTKKRINKILALPETQKNVGLDKIPLYRKNHLDITELSYVSANNGKKYLDNINMKINDGDIIAICGGVDSGKSALVDVLIKSRKATQGAVTFNEIDISQINTAVWRKNYLSVCMNSPKFISGTVRDNMKLLNPTVTDEQILDAFKSIGAVDFMKKFDNVLDFEITENAVLVDGVKNIFNIVRTILKPAEIYVFNQCFVHVREEYISSLVTYLRENNKTAIFVTYSAPVCHHVGTIYVLKGGKIVGMGKHSSLIKSSSAYRDLHASLAGVIAGEEITIDQQISQIEAIAEKHEMDESGAHAGGGVVPL